MPHKIVYQVWPSDAGEEMNMDARQRLHELQSALVERGLMDVKFCFAQNVKSVPPSHVQQDVTDALEAFRNKKYHPLPKAGDSKKK